MSIEATIGDIDVLMLSSDTKHYVDTFDCGLESINRYLRESAIEDISTQTYLFLDVAQDRVISIASLSCSAIISFKKYRTRKVSTVEYSNDKEDIVFCEIDQNYEYSSVQRQLLYHAIEIRNFATNAYYQGKIYVHGKTISHYLFVYLCQNIIIEDLRALVGFTKIVLYSVEKAKNFYERAGFTDFEGFMIADENPYLSKCIPMYYNIAEEFDPNADNFI